MERKTRKKWIIGVITAVILTVGIYVTYEVISFNRDMAELGQGLNELAEGLAKINFSPDTTSTDADSAVVTPDTFRVATDTLDGSDNND